MSFDPASAICFDHTHDAAAYAAAEIAKACEQAVQQRGCFHWVLAGGSTPEHCYRLLKDYPLAWESVHCWFGDERALPPGDAERNETMARNALLDHVEIPESNIHCVDFSLGTAHAAQDYAQQLSGVDCFDFVLLGMGEDGHTASLFPGLVPPEASEDSVALAFPVWHSPKPPAERVSLSLSALNRHRQCMLLVTGASKTEALQRIVDGDKLPIARIIEAQWVLDRSAWPYRI